MPALRTRDTQSKSLEVTTDALQPPTLAVISPTPRAFTFPAVQPPSDSPYSSPSHSPFEPDLRSLPTQCTTSQSATIPRTLSPDSILHLSSPIQPSQVQQHKRRKSSSDVERRPKRGDEDYIKRPENAFILFRRKCCENRQQEEGGLDTPVKKQRQADLSKTISQQWKSLSPEERQYWEQLAKEKKKEHEHMYPNYVYRPQRSKDKSKNKKPIKSRRPENEHETDTESLSFVVPIAPVRHHGRSASAPTPPPYQSIQIPNVYSMTPSCPTSPSLLPMISRRPTHSALEDLSACIPNDGLLVPPQTFRQTGQYETVPTNDYLRDLYSIPNQPTLRRAEQPDLHALTIPQDNFLLPQIIMPISSMPSLGSAPSSPDSDPFSPTSAVLASSFAQLTMPSNGEQQSIDGNHTSDAQLALNLSTDFQFHQQTDLSSFAWESNDLWDSSGETLLTNDDFDLRAIPPIELELPKRPEDISFNPLAFEQDFTHALEGHRCDHDGRHLDSFLVFEEMMAGHGF
ncbi:hypothetical protein AX15_001946 [Amanita polypyramis BW_CC]|nr:hypothetical protein AX15_001946 [Amanita polypyramis BW_CC]